MTQAFNLSQLANNLNTSGQLDATDGLTGATPVANGGTGRNTLTANNVILGNGTGTVNFVAPSTSGNLLTSNGTTWASSALSVGIANFNSYYSSNAVAGTTIISNMVNTVAVFTGMTTYPDFKNSGFDVVGYEPTNGGTILKNGLSNQGQYGYIAVLGGTYRVTFQQTNGNSGTSVESRIVVNSTVVYTVSHTGTSGVTRTFDITVNPFDSVVIQQRKTAGTSIGYTYNVSFGTTGGGLLMQRG
jgi:hypothetical protein